MKRPLIILTGPTAVGKTELSIRLAKRIGGSIVSADSMQVYKWMNIGSAKITRDEMQGVPHYLIDFLEPDEEFNVAKFQFYAKEAMEQIYAQGRIPILTGGTGFYIQAVLYDIDFSKQMIQEEYRKELEKLAEEKGTEALHEQLARVDPASAGAIHANNVKRVIRALEYYRLTGKRISDHNQKERSKQSPYNFAYFVLNDERSRLYDKIEQRVDQMIAQGLVEEVRRLKEMGYTQDLVSMQGLGYKELFPYLNGTCTLDEAVYVIKRDTRHFAKRKLTWFRREKEVIWVDKGRFSYDNDKILDFLCDKITEKGLPTVK